MMLSQGPWSSSRADEKHLHVCEEGGRGSCRKGEETASSRGGEDHFGLCRRERGHGVSRLWQNGSKDHGITTFCVAVGIHYQNKNICRRSPPSLLQYNFL